MNNQEEEFMIKNVEATQECINHLVRINKMLVIVAIIAMLSMVTMHGLTLLYLYQYDYSTSTTTTLEQSTEGGGNANYISGDGDITNGKAESNNDNN